MYYNKFTLIKNYIRGGDKIKTFRSETMSILYSPLYTLRKFLRLPTPFWTPFYEVLKDIFFDQKDELDIFLTGFAVIKYTLQFTEI